MFIASSDLARQKLVPLMNRLGWFSILMLFALPDAAGSPSALSDEEQAGVGFVSQSVEPELFAKLEPEYQRLLLRYAAKLRDGNPPLALCWESHTAPEIVSAFHAVEEASARVRRDRERNPSIGAAFQVDPANHWGNTASGGGGQRIQGLPVTLTWSIVPDGTTIPGGEVNGEGTNEPSNLRAWLQGLYGGSATDPAASQPWFPLFQSVFTEIEAKTGVRYVYEPVDDGATLSGLAGGSGVLGTRGDVRISGHALDGNSNVLAYNYFPDFADMVIDTSDNFYDVTSNNSIRLFNVLSHEHGHGLGLEHVCPVDNTKLMEPFINLGFSGFQFDDVYSAQRLYGDFLESHASETDNDVIGRATSVATPLNTPYVAEWLGIDDNSDGDFFSFTVPAGIQLSVGVIPSGLAYLEGEQNPTTGNCTAGVDFDSSTVHDLAFDIIASDQSTIIASGNTSPAGAAESVADLVIATAGTYYVHVTGGNADFNQLYRLEIEVSAPSVALQLASTALATELFQGNNGVPDPGETVALEIELASVGLIDALNVQASVAASADVQVFQGLQDYGDIPSGAGASGTFVFAVSGGCGETVVLDLDVTADGGYSATIPVSFVLGAESILLEERFDAGTNLPLGWQSSLSSKGSGWSVVTQAANSAPNAVFAANARQAGSSTLLSPAILIEGGGATLEFSHFFDTETNWDGGVLEINIAGGGWQDILAAGGVFEAGGYNLSIAGTNNPLAGRSGWSGDSGGFVTTVVGLPPATDGQSIQLRWVLGHDNRVQANGWFIDDVVLRSFTCDDSGVALLLSSIDDHASEFSSATDTADVRVSSVLPVPSEIPVILIPGGSADAGADISGFGNLTLAVGNSVASATMTAISDGLVEGVETLMITSNDASGSVMISIEDTPYGQWAADNLGVVGAVGPGEDFDDDGFANVDELVNGTDASLAAAVPSRGLLPQGASVKLPVPLGSVPVDIVVDAQTSTDIENWTTDGIIRVADGFEFSSEGPWRFVRLRYSILDAAP